jgi:hypothetical protein
MFNVNNLCFFKKCNGAIRQAFRLGLNRQSLWQANQLEQVTGRPGNRIRNFQGTLDEYFVVADVKVVAREPQYKSVITDYFIGKTVGQDVNRLTPIG